MPHAERYPRGGRSALLRAVALLVAATAACEPPDEAPAPAPSPREARFVGAEACRPCHEPQSDLWRNSHHDRAMEVAGPETVLGNFDGARFTHFGVTSRFFRRDGRFLVATDGPDGELHEYPIAYTFGVDPLQQYLIEFPGGRYQALGLAWDTRPATDGGQRWFHLYPGERLAPGDPLHWTGLDQNWNFMCAECHSTALSKGFDLARRRYRTTWEELDVACEACHGPGSLHVAWAEAREKGGPDLVDRALVVQFPRYDPTVWVLDPGGTSARRTAPQEAPSEIEACARCHSRRGVLRDPYRYGRPLLDTHRPALLDEGLYHADGQILEEVYVYGSFLQSRMFAFGVRCSDCHDAHSLQLRAPANALCGRCHRPEHYDDPGHHHHPVGSTGTSCVACHMASRLYMVVDLRHDHSFRIPRPALTASLGTPNTCSDCHADRTLEWVTTAVEEWYGPGRGTGRVFEPHYGEVLAAGRRGLPDAPPRLAGLVAESAQPAIVRATALRLLRAQPGADAEAVAVRALRDADPLVRAAALEVVEVLPPELRLRRATSLLRDPVLGVRIAAARALADVPREHWKSGEYAALTAAIAEYRSAQLATAERPESHLNLGLLALAQGDRTEARRENELALSLDRSFVPATVNLADLARLDGREADAERLLREALAVAPASPEVLHALGLTLVRRQRLAEAVGLLQRAAELAPDRARYAYVCAMALHAQGESERGLEVLERALARRPGDRELLGGLVAIARDSGALARARGYAADLLALHPDDPGLQSLVRELEPRR